MSIYLSVTLSITFLSPPPLILLTRKKKKKKQLVTILNHNMTNETPKLIVLGPHPHETTIMKKKRTKLFQVDNITACSSSDTPTTPKIIDTSMKMSKIKVFQVGSMTDISAPVKRKKKPDPNAPKITRPCTECGKRFWSWKALFGHMRCHPERNWRGINPPPAKLRKPESGRAVMVTEEEEEELEVAACLLMLANGPQKQYAHPIISAKPDIYSSNPVYKSLNVNGSASTSLNPTSVDPHCTLMATLGYDVNGMDRDYEPVTNLGDNNQFECSSCKKVFGSRQALGGHRASHKNVKGCFAIHNKGGDDVAEGGEVREERETVAALGHKCGTCFRVFSSGQALGGHMRCHFEKGGLNCLDLNLPAPVEDYCDFNHTFSRLSSGVALDLRLGI